MSKKPVLVLQFRRLGDLILTFPLLAQLQTLYPGHPIWLAAQTSFFEPLMPFSPKVTHFPPQALPQLAKNRYEAIINLGGSQAAAICAAKAPAEYKLGPMQFESAARISGFWQLYRESLILNNRHNIFHWADLNRMDLGLPTATLASKAIAPAGSKKIGLFVGASEPAKRPDPSFWVDVCKRLISRGYKPVLFGGVGESQIGADIAQNAPAINFCGKTNLSQLANLFTGLDLLITPDTGPMHLANLLSVPVLNLSMGNVNCAETGPCSPGQHILQASMSCAGCWQCSRPSLVCKNRFFPSQACHIAMDCLQGISTGVYPGQLLLQTSRDNLGLATLEHPVLNNRLLIDQFWKSAFLSFFNPALESDLKKQSEKLGANAPIIKNKLHGAISKILSSLIFNKKKNLSIGDEFWKKQPAHTRLFAGFIHMSLENEDYSPSAYKTVLAHFDLILSNI